MRNDSYWHEILKLAENSTFYTIIDWERWETVKKSFMAGWCVWVTNYVTVCDLCFVICHQSVFTPVSVSAGITQIWTYTGHCHVITHKYIQIIKMKYFYQKKSEKNPGFSMKCVVFALARTVMRKCWLCGVSSMQL